MTTPTLTPEHAEWLRARRLDPTQCARNGIASRGRSLSFTFRDQDGTELFRKLRGPGKSFWIEPKGAKLRLWGLDRLEDVWRAGHGSTLVLTEGELDAEAVIESGWGCVASVPNGAPARPGHGAVDPHADTGFSYLWDDNGLRAEFARPERIVLFVDNDEPGQILRDELALRLGPERCYVVAYPDGCKDANDVKIKLGADAVLAMIEAAQPIIPSRIVDLEDIPVSARRHTYSSGWSALDPHLMLAPPELVVVTGRPGSGKSAWTLNWMLQLARLHRLPGVVIQFEDDIERVRREINNYKARWGLPADWNQGHVRVIAPSVEEEDARDINWLRETIAEAATRHGARWIVIDPWNEIEHMWGNQTNESTYINNALREIKRLGRRYGIAIVIVAHPDKSGGRHESIDEMSLYSINGGAAWKNKADGGIIIDRIKSESGSYTNQTHIKIDKRKDQELMGVPGLVTMEYDRVSRLFVPAGKVPTSAPAPRPEPTHYDDKIAPFPTRS